MYFGMGLHILDLSQLRIRSFLNFEAKQRDLQIEHNLECDLNWSCGSFTSIEIYYNVINLFVNLHRDSSHGNHE